MANKRIELEQYKHYLDLLQEEPNRKMWLRGVEIAFVGAALFALAMFVLGMLSGSLASNSRNVLELPPAKQSPTQQGTTPGVTPTGTPGTETPFSPTQQQGTPITPGGQQQNIPVAPQGSPGGKAPSAPLAERVSNGIPFGAGDGALIAQAQTATPETQSPSTPIDLQQSTPVETTSSAPGQQSGKKSAKSKGPGDQTKGVGNLANLVNVAGGRGFQLYLLVIFMGLLIILYLPVRKARREGKSK